MENSKKIAVITGVLGGIGSASALALGGAGYSVVGMDVCPADSADLSRFADIDITYVGGDLRSTEDRARLIAKAEELGGIDALINVAGVAPKVRRDILEMTEESYDFVTDVNTRGTFFLTQAAANVMIEQYKAEGRGGHIVNISSCSAYTSSVSRGEYCISKAGVTMITTLFADRLAEFGIPVNEVCPGIIRTGMTAAVKEKYDRLIGGGLVPMQRWGEPEDVARLVLAMCTGAFDYVTGASVACDGGLHIRKL